MCNDCEKINTCGEIFYSACVKYEGVIPSFSKYVDDCDVTVEEAIEELYTLVNLTPIDTNYFAGTGLTLTDRTFSVNFGLTPNTVMMGSWRPTWDDIIGKPNFPEPVNLIAGTNITIGGTYPNLVINATNTGENNIIEKVSLGTNLANIVDKTAMIPITTPSVLGLMRVGTGLTVTPDGIVSSLPSVYTAGNGLTLTGNQFSLPVTTVGTGTFVQSVIQNSTGITVTMGTPTGGSYQAGTLQMLLQGIVINEMLWSPKILHDWLMSYDYTTFSATTPNSSHVTYENAVFAAGTNMTISHVGDTFTFSAGLGTSYTAGSGIDITSNVISNTSPNATHTGDVTGSSALTIASKAVTNSKLADMLGDTIKGNITGNVASPQDIGMNDFRVMLASQQCHVYDTPVTSQVIDLKTKHHTTIFINNSSGTWSFILPDGEFDGQQVNIYTADPTSETTSIVGNIVRWTNPPADISGNPFLIRNDNMEHLYWSEIRNKWYAGL